MTYPTHKDYNTKITTETGEEFFINAFWLNNNDHNRFTGWKCTTGTTRIDIDKNLDVFNGKCKTATLGNLLTGWNLIKEQITCPNQKCTTNPDDLMTFKYHPIGPASTEVQSPETAVTDTQHKYFFKKDE